MLDLDGEGSHMSSEGLDFPARTIENLRVFQARMSHGQIRMLESSL